MTEKTFTWTNIWGDQHHYANKHFAQTFAMPNLGSGAMIANNDQVQAQRGPLLYQ